MQHSLVQAQAASTAKSDFLSSMSHEPRTPLNSILGFGQLLADDPANPLTEKHQRFSQQILDNGEYLLALINQVLDLAKIEAGAVPVTLEEVAVSDVVTDCAAMSAPLAEKQGVALVIEPIKEGLVCQADALQMRHVLLNLVSNAIKFNNADGQVHVETKQLDSSFVRICVADTGPGLSDEHQTQLFEPFNRLAFENSGVHGSGVGLTIAKQLAELMGGSVGFTSQLGEGSTFWIDLPMSAGA